MARLTRELENNIPSAVDSSPESADTDAIYHYDDAATAKIQQEKPWSQDPHFFRRVKISALALLKMVVHARSGGTIEIMGLMQGKTEGDTIIVMDAFALPIQGTETRVNADAYEYMVDYSPTNKSYYSLDISYFKSSLDNHLLDLLWNKYWVNTLSSSPLLGNRDYVAGQISDLAEKLEQAENQLATTRMGSSSFSSSRKKEESQLAKITRDSSKITVEQVHGLMSQVIKDTLFNSVRQSSRACSCSADSGPEPMVEA